MDLTDIERHVVTTVADRRDELIGIAGCLISYDTTTRDGTGPRQERRLQDYLANRLDGIGAQVDLWEPVTDTFNGSRQTTPGLDFTGYPQLLAHVTGTGGGRNLLFNGHVDTVSPEPKKAWTSDPYRAELREGRLYGRGACDQKGGVAAMVFAAEVLSACDVTLAGDLLVSTVTDEESTSAGALATVARRPRADAAIVTEPTGLNIGIACRGSLMPTITIPGVAGHAAAIQPHWRHGGAVSAVEKSATVLTALARLREHWWSSPDHRHDYLPPGNVLATMINGGQWQVSYADSCQISCHVSYLPAHADADGYGSQVKREFTEWIQRHAATDPWLCSNPPRVTWSPIDVPPAEIAPEQPIVGTLRAAAGSLTAAGALFGTDFWHDGATFIRSGIPTAVFGPGQVKIAHTVDEFVQVDDLVKAAQVLAVTAMRFCGIAG